MAHSTCVLYNKIISVRFESVVINLNFSRVWRLMGSIRIRTRSNGYLRRRMLRLTLSRFRPSLLARVVSHSLSGGYFNNWNLVDVLIVVLFINNFEWQFKLSACSAHLWPRLCIILGFRSVHSRSTKRIAGDRFVFVRDLRIIDPSLGNCLNPTEYVLSILLLRTPTITKSLTRTRASSSWRFSLSASTLLGYRKCDWEIRKQRRSN